MLLPGMLLQSQQHLDTRLEELEHCWQMAFLNCERLVDLSSVLIAITNACQDEPSQQQSHKLAPKRPDSPSSSPIRPSVQQIANNMKAMGGLGNGPRKPAMSARDLLGSKGHPPPKPAKGPTKSPPPLIVKPTAPPKPQMPTTSKPPPHLPFLLVPLLDTILLSWWNRRP